MSDAKPVLWISVTSHGRIDSQGSLDDVQERLEDTDLADDYSIVVADDRVRLADAEDIEETLRAVGELAQEADLLD